MKQHIIDAIYVPAEESSAHIPGERLSYWNDSIIAGRSVGSTGREVGVFFQIRISTNEKAA
jgi:hypothetical protein